MQIILEGPHRKRHSIIARDSRPRKSAASKIWNRCRAQIRISFKKRGCARGFECPISQPLWCFCPLSLHICHGIETISGMQLVTLMKKDELGRKKKNLKFWSGLFEATAFLGPDKRLFKSKGIQDEITIRCGYFKFRRIIQREGLGENEHPISRQGENVLSIFFSPIGLSPREVPCVEFFLSFQVQVCQSLSLN